MLVATVLTACGIETEFRPREAGYCLRGLAPVATVLTACGIETRVSYCILGMEGGLQQYLPLAVLKLSSTSKKERKIGVLLQQYLPLAVLKPSKAALTKP